MVKIVPYYNQIFTAMGRITATNVAFDTVTMVMVYLGGETNIYCCIDVGKLSKFSVNGT